MRDSPCNVRIAREGSRNVDWIVVARYAGISFVASRGSDEKFSFRVKRNSVVKVDRLLDTGAVALEIVNYRVSVTLTGNVLDRCNLYNLLCR